MRVTWHPEADVVVLSLWRENACVGTLRLERHEVPALVARAGRRPGRRPLGVPLRRPGRSRRRLVLTALAMIHDRIGAIA